MHLFTLDAPFPIHLSLYLPSFTILSSLLSSLTTISLPFCRKAVFRFSLAWHNRGTAWDQGRRDLVSTTTMHSAMVVTAMMS